MSDRKPIFDSAALGALPSEPPRPRRRLSDQLGELAGTERSGTAASTPASARAAPQDSSASGHVGVVETRATLDTAAERETEREFRERGTRPMDRYEKRRRMAMLVAGKTNISAIAREIGCDPRTLANLIAGDFRSRGAGSADLEAKFSAAVNGDDRKLWPKMKPKPDAPAETAEPDDDAETAEPDDDAETDAESDAETDETDNAAESDGLDGAAGGEAVTEPVTEPEPHERAGEP